MPQQEPTQVPAPSPRPGNGTRQAAVHRLPMAHPGDVSALEDLIRSGAVDPARILAVMGKTEGNGGVNDFTRGYFGQTLMALLGRHLGRDPAMLAREIPCVFSGGTEGVLSPHYLVLCESASEVGPGAGGALAFGVAFSEPLPAEHVGRLAHIMSVAAAVRAAMEQASIEDPDQVHFVQVKCPCITAQRAQAALARGQTPLTNDSRRSMAYARAAGALGVALALGEIQPGQIEEGAALQDFSLYSTRASISSGVEVDCNEVIVFGQSPHWTGPLRIAHRPMSDALDIGAVCRVLDDVGISAQPQVALEDAARIAGVLVKCEPDRRGVVRGNRHTMLDDTDIDAQRHIRGALGGLVASVMGDGRVFVSGGAEHQGPDGGGLIAVIAHRAASTAAA